MSTITIERITEVLARDHVQKFLTRRNENPTCTGCKEEVPLNLDGNWMAHFFLAVKCNLQMDSDNCGARFISRYQHTSPFCPYETNAFRQEIDPKSQYYDEEMYSFYNMLSTTPIQLRSGLWVLG